MNLYISYLLLYCQSFNTPTIPLQVEITHIKTPKGILRIGIFVENSTFGTAFSKPSFGHVVEINSLRTQRFTINLPQGKYSLALYHDINNNGKLDLNWFGYPKEPFAFSNNYRPVFRGPHFKECEFDMRADGVNSLKIKLLAGF